MLYSIDWSHKEQNLSVFDGNKSTNKLPIPDKNIIIATENMPAKMAKPYLDIGAKVYRTTCVQTEKYRKELKIDKSHEVDAKILYILYKNKPEEFYEFKIDLVLYDLNVAYNWFKDIQKLRTSSENRLWANPDSELAKLQEKQLIEQEKQALKEVNKRLKKLPIYTNFLYKVKGIGPSIAGGLIAMVGDIKRFPNVSCLMSYFGLHVVNGKAPRKQKGKQANWHQDGRALLLGILADSFIKQRTPKYREIYDKEKIKQKEICEKLIIAEKRARRKAVKQFVKDFYKEYNKIIK